MDVDAIRSRFIQDNLRRALLEQDKARAARALRAFRSYFQWFEHRLPDLEKLAIMSQLSKLEEAYTRQSTEDRRSEPCHASAR
ncbi:MAG TPA: hypothetical protein VK708_05060 [Bryobacteraceae bacterium]|jgi:hypothetical protein|nr:hypothetical protein [Bryobacteraceae bacterium]